MDSNYSDTHCIVIIQYHAVIVTSLEKNQIWSYRPNTETDNYFVKLVIVDTNLF
jgi:hypothetical protein